MGGGTGKKAKEENEGQEPPSCEDIPHFPFFVTAEGGAASQWVTGGAVWCVVRLQHMIGQPCAV